MSRWGSRLGTMGLLMVLPALLGCPASGPGVTVYPIAFNFGSAANATTDWFTVSSRGSGEVAWHIENLPAWASVDPASGSAGRDGQRVDITIDRSGFAPGLHTGEFQVVTADTSMTVALSLQVTPPPLDPTLVVNPVTLDLGLSSISETLVASNAGTGTVDWSVTKDDPWINVSPTSGHAASGSSGDTITVSVDRSGLSAGPHTTTLHFTSHAGDVDVPVALQMPAQEPLLSLSTTSLDFGASTTSLTLPVTNAGSGTMHWTATTNVSWLSVAPNNGQLPPATLPLTVTVDRTGMALGNHAGTITIATDGGNATVNVLMSVAVPKLAVNPSTLQFGSFITSKLLTIANSGSGSLQWTIDGSKFPTWLKASIEQGTAGGEASAVVVSCDRTNWTTGNYTYTFTVQSPAGNADVTATMTVGPKPVLTVETGYVNKDDEPLVPMGTEETEFVFGIRNTGTGTLDWSLDGSALPEWLSVTPLTGALTVGEVSLVHVTVDRSTLPTGGYAYRIPLNSNAEDTFVEVSMLVPLRVAIGVDPDQLKLGSDSDIGTCYVANIGDANTMLNYKVESDKEWLFFSPATNSSVGTAGNIKDWKRVNVAVDRSMLESNGGTATLTVTAVDGAGEPLDNVAPRQIAVSIESPSLSFEAAQARTREPSLVRFNFIMRDVRNAALFTDPAFLENQNAFRIYEDGVEIENTETNKFVVGWEKLKVNVVLLLDLSGSMLDGAAQAGLTGQEPLLDLYRNVCTPFLQSLPPNWKVSLREFHDVGQLPNTGEICGFTLDRDALAQSLHNFHIQDYGASELLSAIHVSAGQLENEDGPLTPFDDADVRAIVVISDGRRTTPPGDIDESCDFLFTKAYTRVYSVGWGQDVEHESLARLASKTGGHYYSTRTDANGHANPAELNRVLQQLSSDFRAYRMLGYTTLNWSDQVNVRVTGFFNAPGDVPDRGIIQGTFTQQLKPADIVGNSFVGRISMRSNGIDGNGDATVFIHSDYIPRNVNKLQFTVTTTQPFTLSVTPTAENGLLGDWILQDLGQGLYRLDSPGGFLPFGAFGDLVQLSFAGAQAPFDVGLTVDNTIYQQDLEPKSFAFPQGLQVKLGEPSVASDLTGP